MDLSVCFTGCFYTQSTDKSLEHCSSLLGVSTGAHPGKPVINRCRSVRGEPFTAILGPEAPVNGVINRCRSVRGEPFTAILGPEAPVNGVIIHRSTDKGKLFVVQGA